MEIEFAICKRCDTGIGYGYAQPTHLTEWHSYSTCAACGKDLELAWWAEPVRLTFPVDMRGERVSGGIRYKRLAGYISRLIG
jgi:hypothetical protein